MQEALSKVDATDLTPEEKGQLEDPINAEDTTTINTVLNAPTDMTAEKCRGFLSRRTRGILLLFRVKVSFP